jgi:hypothetical protein
MNRSNRTVFWVGQAVGIAVILLGVRGLLDARLSEPPSFARFFFGGAIAHDLLLAPLVFAAGWAVKRLVPQWSWPTVRNALFVSVVVSLFSYPFVRGFGRRPSNETVIPRNYAEGLVLVLAVVWMVAAAALIVRRPRALQPDSS